MYKSGRSGASPHKMFSLCQVYQAGLCLAQAFQWVCILAARWPAGYPAGFGRPPPGGHQGLALDVPPVFQGPSEPPSQWPESRIASVDLCTDPPLVVAVVPGRGWGSTGRYGAQQSERPTSLIWQHLHSRNVHPYAGALRKKIHLSVMLGHHDGLRVGKAVSFLTPAYD